VVLTAGLLWHFIAGVPPFGQAGEMMAELVPPVDAPLPQQQQAIDGLARRLILEETHRPSRHPNVAAGSKLTVSRRLADLHPPFRQTINGLLRSSHPGPSPRLPSSLPALCLLLRLLFACS